MGRPACIEPQCLYKGALYIFYLLTVQQAKLIWALYKSLVRISWRTRRMSVTMMIQLRMFRAAVVCANFQSTSWNWEVLWLDETLSLLCVRPGGVQDYSCLLKGRQYPVFVVAVRTKMHSASPARVFTIAISHQICPVLLTQWLMKEHGYAWVIHAWRRYDSNHRLGCTEDTPVAHTGRGFDSRQTDPRCVFYRYIFVQ
jgi:hypothetical protein